MLSRYRSVSTRSAHLALLWFGLLVLPGCWDLPSPLAPGLGGSVGVPHHGVLTEGQPLEQRTDHFHRLRTDDIRWGSPRLVGAIRRASAQVAAEQPGGARLVVADLSARDGGWIPRHRSHRTGRDADLLFYATTPDGRSVRATGFHRFGRDGLARTEAGDFIRIDVPREWLLVKALLEDPEAEIQWLFIARWLEALLIEYAQARGEPDALVWHAAMVMHQPSDSASHDDHIHMRLACSPDEAVAGCWDRGPRWPWLARSPNTCALSDEELIRALLNDDS